MMQNGSVFYRRTREGWVKDRAENGVEGTDRAWPRRLHANGCRKADLGRLRMDV
jgi:hypothetical protein